MEKSDNENIFLNDLFKEQSIIDHINFYFNNKHYKIDLIDTTSNITYEYLTYSNEDETYMFEINKLNNYLISNMTNLEQFKSIFDPLFHHNFYIEDDNNILSIDNSNFS